MFQTAHVCNWAICYHLRKCSEEACFFFFFYLLLRLCFYRLFCDLKCLNLHQASLSPESKHFVPVQSKEEEFFFLVLEPLRPHWMSGSVLSPPELRLTQSHRKQHESRQSSRGIIKTLKTSPSSLSTFQRDPPLWQGVVLLETNLVCIAIIRAKEFQSTCFCERGPLYKVFVLAGFV